MPNVPYDDLTLNQIRLIQRTGIRPGDVVNTLLPFVKELKIDLGANRDVSIRKRGLKSLMNRTMTRSTVNVLNLIGWISNEHRAEFMIVHKEWFGEIRSLKYDNSPLYVRVPVRMQGITPKYCEYICNHRQVIETRTTGANRVTRWLPQEVFTDILKQYRSFKAKEPITPDPKVETFTLTPKPKPKPKPVFYRPMPGNDFEQAMQSFRYDRIMPYVRDIPGFEGDRIRLLMQRFANGEPVENFIIYDIRQYYKTVNNHGRTGS